MSEIDKFLLYNKRWAEVKDKPNDFNNVWDSPLLVERKEQQRENIFRLVQGPQITESDIYQCLKCGSRLVSSSKAQTRAADEETTIKYKCHSCNNTWNG